ncbi:MAG: DNA polymerase IV [Planctomycetes bacterium]|nr:DNA polymerase IV [Planctomycetota bacterium]
MDAFYASIEERENPRLVGKPLIVGGTPEGRGVVAAANYAVRRFGVHSAMPTSTALRLCPDAMVLPPRMDFYAQVSRQIRDILFRFTPLVEPLSLDEAFLDVTGSAGLFGSGEETARRTKEAIRSETALVASVGVAPNKFLAKIASDLKKPDGLVVVEPDRVAEFLDPLPVGRLWGVGKVTGGVFARLGVKTIGQLRRFDPEVLRQQFGQQGEHFWNLAHGLDERPVVPDREAKSISHETTFAVDITDLDALRAWLLELTEHVGRRVRAQKRRGRTIHLKVRFADFHTITRAKTLPQPTDVTREIWRTAAEMLAQALPPGHQGVRLLGVGVSGFDDHGLVQRTLFEQEREKQRQLDAVADAVREKFGFAALSRGSGLLHDARHRPEPRPDDPNADIEVKE